jgi:hypothetical protein
MQKIIFALTMMLIGIHANAQIDMEPPPVSGEADTRTDAQKEEIKNSDKIYLYTANDLPDRKTYVALRENRGTTTEVPVNDVKELCGDADGCKIRMGMYDWDRAGRMASRENLFFYNPFNFSWRAMNGDIQGKDQDGVTNHVMQSWACYFTDGAYSKWKNLNDEAILGGFGLLSWNQADAHCIMTIID